jgi:hypothetical protein
LIYGFSQTLITGESIKYAPSRFPVRVRKSRYFMNTALLFQNRFSDGVVHDGIDKFIRKAI